MQDQGTYGREGELAHEQKCVRALAYAHVQGSENETKRGLRKKTKARHPVQERRAEYENTIRNHSNATGHQNEKTDPVEKGRETA